MITRYLQNQIDFLRFKAELVQFAEANNILLVETEGCLLPKRRSRSGSPFEDGVHMRGSLHYERMATDFMIYDVDGRPVYSGSDPRWTKLGEYWESLDSRCAWGGRFNDANHFSLSYAGKK